MKKHILPFALVCAVLSLAFVSARAQVEKENDTSPDYQWNLWLSPKHWAQTLDAIPWERFMPGGDTQVPGVVALVNGVPISLRQVEARYDMDNATGKSREEELEHLRKAYRDSTISLVTQELVHQELERLGKSVSPEEVQKLENLVRADYPEKTFEEQLASDGIHLDMWREQLLARLEQEKLQDYLRQLCVVPEAEVREYLRQHPEKSKRPASVDIVVARSLDKKQLEQARTSGIRHASGAPAGVEITSMNLAEKRIPSFWAKDLAALKPGQFSAVREEGGAFQYVVLVERHREKNLPTHEAYVLAEADLLEDELAKSFLRWQEEAVLRSNISLAVELHPVD